MATADGQAVPAAGVFTANKMTAAPVLVSRAHLRQSRGHAAADQQIVDVACGQLLR